MIEPVLASVWRSIFGGFLPGLLFLIGIASILLGIVAVVQTRRWPRQQVTKKRPEKAPEPEAQTWIEAPPERKTVRPVTTTDRIRISFPDIDPAHPDVWGQDAPLRLHIEIGERSGATKCQARVLIHTDGHMEEAATAAFEPDGTLTLDISPGAPGEHDIVVEAQEGTTALGQAVRPVRIVDYRSELVETFEDFVAWAASHYDFVDRKMTAREFVDRYADGRPNVPFGPLEQVVDLYELANYSEHPVDRTSYTQMVDSFLELENAGALDGPEDR